jgi:hypothetical protein
VSTVGDDEASVLDYIKKQEIEAARLDQLHFFDGEWPPVGGPRIF